MATIMLAGLCVWIIRWNGEEDEQVLEAQAAEGEEQVAEEEATEEDEPVVEEVAAEE